MADCCWENETSWCEKWHFQLYRLPKAWQACLKEIGQTLTHFLLYSSKKCARPFVLKTPLLCLSSRSTIQVSQSWFPKHSMNWKISSGKCFRSNSAILLLHFCALLLWLPGIKFLFDCHQIPCAWFGRKLSWLGDQINKLYNAQWARRFPQKEEKYRTQVAKGFEWSIF